MREAVNCELPHAGNVQATSTMAVACPDCIERWELVICKEHGRQLNLLIASGQTMTCPCGSIFPVLYNAMFGVLA